MDATPIIDTGASSEGSVESTVASAKQPPAVDWSKIPQSEIDKLIESKSHKVKINGQERDLSFSELKKLASLASASDEKFKNAAAMKAEVEALKKAFDSNDPVATLRKQGKTNSEIKAILEQKYVDLLEEENLDPQTKRLRELEAKEKERELSEKEQKEKAQAEKEAKEAQAVRERCEAEIAEAFGASNLPKHPYILKLVAQEMLGAAENDVEMSAKDAVQIVQKELVSQVSSLLPQMGIEWIKNALGPSLLKSLRADSVKEAKESGGNNLPKFNPKPANSTPKPSSSNNKEEKVSMSSFFTKLHR